jgi:hypothetical protein
MLICTSCTVCNHITYDYSSAHVGTFTMGGARGAGEEGRGGGRHEELLQKCSSFVAGVYARKTVPNKLLKDSSTVL